MNNIGEDFKLRVHSNRWGHYDNYTLIKKENGWTVITMKIHGDEGDKLGSPAIEKAFDRESFSYPNDLGYFLSHIWDASETKTKEEVQKYFDELGEWISTTEKTKPNFGALHL
ncbi:hypothetical protein JFV29_09415 [Peribacillus sp. TH16]|uniref:hypothetical protein n=1 Tax=Peribacillus sp. TH16 TaxID=2798482 RepID=UPI0019112B9F|nr:hypothetical protein [Peribacillus sp. TH16]MBK5482141.1 hypothetical protein [Peribacillus sp. TH16]